jgi:outer membrane receptor for Fe3+-dicitrate
VRRPPAGSRGRPGCRGAAPGSTRVIRLRGPADPYTGHPLVVIDGVVYPTAPDSAGVAARLPELRPEEVDTVEVLKGAAAVARFGPAARDGVVLVRTKRTKPAAPGRL